MITLSPYEEQLIQEKLPPQLSAFTSKYPSAVYNAASVQHLPPLTVDTKPSLINIYYGDEDNNACLPNLSFKDGKLDLLYLTEECVNSPVIQIEVNSDWVYIEIEKQIILDRIGDLQLPKIENITEDELFTITSKTQLLLEGVGNELFE